MNKSNDDCTIAREQSVVRHFQLVIARDALEMSLFQKKKSNHQLVANKYELAIVLCSLVASGDQFEMSSCQFKKSNDPWEKSNDQFKKSHFD